MPESWQWIPCPACKALDFNVRYNQLDGLAHVVCRACRNELLTGQVTPPKENVPVRPI